MTLDDVFIHAGAVFAFVGFLGVLALMTYFFVDEFGLGGLPFAAMTVGLGLLIVGNILEPRYA